MNANLKVALVFTLCLAIVLFLTNQFVLNTLQNCPVDNIAKVNAVMNHEIDAAITIWGSSTAKVQFDAEMIQKKSGATCFNLGMEGTPFQQYSGLLEEYLDYSKNGKLLIIAIDINGFESRATVFQGYSWLHHIHNAHIYASIKSIDSDLALKSRYMPLYYITTYDRRFLPYRFKWVSRAMEGEPELTHLGYHANDEPWNAGPAKKEKPFSVEVNQEVVAKMKEVLGRAVKMGIKVAIVVPPCYIGALKNMLNMAEFEKTINSFGSVSIRTYDYLHDPICVDMENFVNNTHLNKRGAEKFSEELIKNLQ